mgnify:CR=1 FL=1
MLYFVLIYIIIYLFLYQSHSRHKTNLFWNIIFDAKVHYVLVVIMSIFINWAAHESFDAFEYSSIWLITIMMSVFGMTTALITGANMALFIYFIQTFFYQYSVRDSMLATLLCSSCWNCPLWDNTIIENETF